MFNVKIEFIPRDTDVRVSEIMAGAPSAHIYSRSHSQFEDITAAGAALPLDDFLDEEFFANAQPWFVNNLDRLRVGPHLYGINMPAIPIGRAIVWNKEIFEREGLDPDLVHHLYDAGEWTWENFFALQVQLTKDTTGDGELDSSTNPDSIVERAGKRSTPSSMTSPFILTSITAMGMKNGLLSTSCGNFSAACPRS